MKTYLDKSTVDERMTQRQFATFFVDGNLYGIDVMKVQEVTRPLEITPMRTAPEFIKGLINLRGQIATAIGLREIFGLKMPSHPGNMTVVCKIEDVLLSLIVDKIGDVVEVGEDRFEPAPSTLPSNIRLFMEGVYKIEGSVLSVINLEFVLRELDKRCA